MLRLSEKDVPDDVVGNVFRLLDNGEGCWRQPSSRPTYIDVQVPATFSASTTGVQRSHIDMTVPRVVEGSGSGRP